MVLLIMGFEMTFKPLLATAADDLEKLQFPLYASAKLDGYRCICINHTGLSRNLKPIRNNYVRNKLEEYSSVLDGFDGELCLSDLTAPFNEVSSAISSADGEPDFTYVIFDYHSEPESGYEKRFLSKVDQDFPDFVKVVPYAYVTDVEGLMRIHKLWTDQGFEGTMVRRADGKDHYKYGRSTVNEAILLKIKDFADTEAVVLGFTERMHNANEATKSLTGHTERSSHKANMIPMDTLGAIVVKSDDFDEPFEIGTGFDDTTRAEIWHNQAKYLGKLVTFQHQPSGAKKGGKPRFPSFKGFRCEDDL